MFYQIQTHVQTQIRALSSVRLALILISMAIISSGFLGVAEAARCGARLQHHYAPAKPGKLLNPYNRRMKAKSYIPIGYAVVTKGSVGRTMESRLPATKSLAACKAKIRSCFQKKLRKAKGYVYCVKTNARGKVARTYRIR